MSNRLWSGVTALIVPLALSLASQNILNAIRVLASIGSPPANGPQTAAPAPTPSKPVGSIVGVVTDGKKPVPRAQVQAFPAAIVQQGETAFSSRASGTASTDADGKFQIAGLEPGEYLVAADAVPTIFSAESTATTIFATTFYPSTIDFHSAVPVSASAERATPIQIELVRVNGVRVTGSAVSRSGRPTGGMDVSLFRQFGHFGSGNRVAVVRGDGSFEIPRVRPGTYRLTIAPPMPASNDAAGEVASTLLQVRDRDVDGLTLVLEAGASVSGHVVAEAGSGLSSGVGLRVSASPRPEPHSVTRPISASVAFDWSFSMKGLSGSYQFMVSADRRPFVKATRITVDGVEAPIDRVDLTRGTHEVVVHVSPREPPASTVDRMLSSEALMEQFKNEPVFWRQFEIAKSIVERRDGSVLASLTPWLSHENRRIRGNAAFVFARLGDPRGFTTIVDILNDRSDRREGEWIPSSTSLVKRTPERAWLQKNALHLMARQIRADRYYAAHLLGELRDPQAVPILVPLLKDPDVNTGVLWALEQIGDRSAIAPLIAVLDDESPSMRVRAIYALEELRAREPLPRLTSLLDDHRKSNFGAQVTVADAARAAIAKLQ